MGFRDRKDAGRRLAGALGRYGADAVVLGLPRGGVPVAYEVAKELGAPLDVIVVRKLGVPYQPELAMGAIGEGGVRVVSNEILRAAGVDEHELALVERRERVELDRRVRRFRGGRERVPLAGRTAIVVDDGIATGSTARAACQVARAHGASRIVLAVPVAARSSVRALQGIADEVVCLESPEDFAAVGQWYRDFTPTSDDEVTRLLDRAAAGAAAALAPAAPADPPPLDEEVRIDAGAVHLAGQLTVPAPSKGLVVFAHGSGSSRHSPRNRYVAQALNEAGLATLLVDLLTVDEERERAFVFDIELLAGRLVDVVAWARLQPALAAMPVGYFGASTGAGAALWAAADPDSAVEAVVSRGGRPDLAAARLAEVRAPTLLLVGGNDDVVVDLNREAQALLRCESRLDIVPGATHLFEEPGALEAVAHLAAQWFLAHFPP